MKNFTARSFNKASLSYVSFISSLNFILKLNWNYFKECM